MKYISLPSCREVEEDIDTKLCCLKKKQKKTTQKSGFSLVFKRPAG